MVLRYKYLRLENRDGSWTCRVESKAEILLVVLLASVRFCSAIATSNRPSMPTSPWLAEHDEYPQVEEKKCLKCWAIDRIFTKNQSCSVMTGNCWLGITESNYVLLDNQNVLTYIQDQLEENNCQLKQLQPRGIELIWTRIFFISLSTKVKSSTDR
jgi:hypothetical protein